MSALYVPTAEDVKQRLRPFGFFFEKSLKDLIKGIRANNETPEKLHKFLTEQLSECREEVNSSNMNLKTNGVLKLAYLEMYGFDMSWCNFHILEVMSSNKLQQKRVGYLAASQSLHKDPDVLMLATNLFKKDLKFSTTQDVFKIGIALNGLSLIMTTELARDISNDLFMMMSSSKPYLRKKAVAALYKVFLEYPEALRDNFDQFASMLEDNDTSVVSAMVSVICELSKKNPHPFVRLSPLLYEILLTVDNNWIIIRLLKLFTNLSQIEPKLKNKLLPKIIELMDSTMATSVLYESINCIVKGNMLDEYDYNTAARSLERLNKFCYSQDPNLRYISCVLFYKIGKINPKFIARYDRLIIQLLSDVDVSIRSKALELLKGIVTKKNVKRIVTTLMKQFVNEEVVVLQTMRSGKREIPIVIPDSYKVKIVSTIIEVCSMNTYSAIDDIEWYNAVLHDLTLISRDLPDKSLGRLIGEQFTNLMVRIPDLRDVTMTTIVRILAMDGIDTQLPTVLKECIWCLGEYSQFLDNGDDMIRLLVRRGSKFNSMTQDVLIFALLKIFSNWCQSANAQPDSVREVLNTLVDFLEELTRSRHFEVQESSVEFTEFLKLCLDSMEEYQGELPLLITEVLPSFFNNYEFNPISRDTQKHLAKVKEIDFDLETPFITEDELAKIIEDNTKLAQSTSNLFGNLDSDGEETRYDSDSSYDLQYGASRPLRGHSGTGSGDLGTSSADEQEEEDKRLERLSNPFYLGGESDSKGGSKSAQVKDLLLFDNRDDSEFKESTIPLSSDGTEEGKKKTKKAKKKPRKVRVLADEVYVPPGVDDHSDTRDSGAPYSASSHEKRDKISLKKYSKLESFSFTENPSTGKGDESAELERLRSKFESTTLGHEPSADTTEEVIVKRKRHKSKSKDRDRERDSSGKKKKKSGKKDKKSSSEDGETFTSSEPKTGESAATEV